MATITKKGYGQVEPNHLSAQRTAQIYAQLPLEMEQLEQGQFAKYDLKTGKVNLSGAGEWMLCFSEVKTYGPRETAADFVNVKDGVYPRLFKTNVGDIFTTNTVKGNIEEDTVLKIDATGYLAVDGTSDEQWQVVKITTLPDGQDAVKVMRIK